MFEFHFGKEGRNKGKNEGKGRKEGTKEKEGRKTYYRYTIDESKQQMNKGVSF